MSNLVDVHMAPALERIYHEHATTFVFYELMRALRDFDCGPFEADTYITWFWKVAPTWAPKNSQAEFNAFARARLSEKIGYTRKRCSVLGL